MLGTGDSVDQLAERVAALRPRLDEVSLRRIQARVHAQLDAERHAAPRRRAAWVVLAAAAASLLLWLWPQRPARVATPRRAPPPSAPLASAPAPSAAPAVAPSPALPALALLLPYLVAGTDAQRAGDLLGRPLAQLTLKRGERVLLALARRARFSLEGPARLSVERATDTRVELRLAEGTLVGDYDHRQGGELAIHTADTSTEVVGTLFSVRVNGEHTRVAVARGAVRVRTGTDAWLRVGARQALSSESPTLVAPDTTELQALHRLARSLSAPAGEVHATLSVTDQTLRVEVAGQYVGVGPVWALVPPGATQLTLRDADQRRERAGPAHGGRHDQLVAAGAAQPAEDVGAGPPSTADATSASKFPVEGEAMYRAAEAAMHAGEHDRAMAQLVELVERLPDARSIDLVLFDLAQLSLQQKHYDAASAWLERLREHGVRRGLNEPVRALRCKLERARGTLGAEANCP